MSLEAIKSAVQDQFNQNVHHYLHGSPMDDHELLSLIVRLAEPKDDYHLLDVACGAGFLAAEFARVVSSVTGVDLSEAMLAEARNNAHQLGFGNISFELADVEALPYADETFDIVSCKLALHYFPNPSRAIGEMVRVARKGGRVVLVDRVSSENRHTQAYHNVIEKLRTPAKVKVYSPSEIVVLMEQQGLVVEQVQTYEQLQDVDDWLQTTGAPEACRQEARELMLRSQNEDVAVLNLRFEEGRLVMTHDTVIVVAKKAAA